MLIFFDNFNFERLYFLKSCPIFVDSALCLFKKFNNDMFNFGQNLSKFGPPN